MKQRKPIARKSSRHKRTAVWKQVSDALSAEKSLANQDASDTIASCSVSQSASQMKRRAWGNSATISGAKKKKRVSVKKITEHQKKRLAKLKDIRDRWWAEGRRICGICNKQIRERENYTLDHVEPGYTKSDSEDNLQPAHWYPCNFAKGSKRDFHL